MRRSMPTKEINMISKANNLLLEEDITPRGRNIDEFRSSPALSAIGGMIVVEFEIQKRL